MSTRKPARLLGLALTLLGSAVLAQDDSWRKEIDNNLVRAARRVVAPHETVSAAVLPPALLVFLTDYSVRLTTPARQEELQGKVGQFLWHSGGRIGLENLSERRLEIVQVAPKFSPASEPVSEVPGSRNGVFENDLIHVRHVHFAPERKVAEQVLPSVVLHLSGAHIKLTHADGQVEEFRMKAGDIRFESGGVFTAENLGDWVEALRVQLKAGKRDRN